MWHPANAQQPVNPRDRGSAYRTQAQPLVATNREQITHLPDTLSDWVHVTHLLLLTALGLGCQFLSAGEHTFAQPVVHYTCCDRADYSIPTLPPISKVLFPICGLEQRAQYISGASVQR